MPHHSGSGKDQWCEGSMFNVHAINSSAQIATEERGEVGDEMVLDNDFFHINNLSSEDQAAVRGHSPDG